MTMKTLRGVKESTWLEMKSMAAKRGVPIARLLDIMIEDYSKISETFWKKIFESEKILSDEEARSMDKVTREIRKERGFR